MCPRTKSQQVAETAREPNDSDDNTNKNESNTTLRHLQPQCVRMDISKKTRRKKRKWKEGEEREGGAPGLRSQRKRNKICLDEK